MEGSVPAAASAVAALPVAPRVLLVTSSDTRYMPLLRMMLGSVHAHPASQGIDLAILDVGLAPDDLAWLDRYSPLVAQPRAHFGAAAQAGLMDRAVMARPFLREYFPGYDIYLWLDSDLWVQRWSAVAALIDGAAHHGLAIAHEAERAYGLNLRLLGWKVKHALQGYQPRQVQRIVRGRSLNAGIFALHAASPIWEAWATHFRAAQARTGRLAPHDQFALSLAAFEVGGAAILPPAANWICARGLPMWDDAAGAFCVPYAPHTPIGILHLAGPAKRVRYAIRRTGGGEFETYLVHGASPGRPGGDIWSA